MSLQSFEDVKVGDILYLTELTGDAPVSVYVIRGSQGDMLIDTGFFSTKRHILNWIKRNGFNIKDIFITHAHPDHDWNAAGLKKRFNARIWMSEKDVSLIRNFNSQPQIPVAPEFEKRVKRISFWTGTPFFRSRQYEPDILVEQGDQEAAKYGYDIKFIPLPGHTLGSYGILKGDVLYAGDAYAVLNGTPMLPPHVTDLEKMRESYGKIKELAPAYLACGHGVPFEFSSRQE